MRGNRSLIITVILSALIAWALGFLRLPYLEENYSFLFGFITCSAIILLGFIFIFAWNRSAILNTNDPLESSQSKRFLRKYVAIFIISGVVISSILLFVQNKKLRNHIRIQNIKFEKQEAAINFNTNNNLSHLMRQILDKVDDELKDNPKRILHSETIDRIVAISQGFQAYNLDGDSLSGMKLSPERGQFLLALLKVNLDSTSLNEILRQANFSGADLRGSDLKGLRLNKADLRGANMKDVNLSGAEFKNADLRETNLWGAILNDSNLSGANLRRANLAWAEMNGVNLSKANLEEARLQNAKLKLAILDQANLKWAELDGAILTHAKLIGANLTGVSLNKSNLSNANLKASVLTLAKLEETVLTGTKLNKAFVYEKNWIEMLKDWRVIGIKDIYDTYEVVKNSADSHRIELRKRVD